MLQSIGDHNRLGREMKLFTTVDVIGQGLPLFTPKGTKMIQILQRWIEDLEDNEWGYVRTPKDYPTNHCQKECQKHLTRFFYRW